MPTTPRKSARDVAPVHRPGHVLETRGAGYLVKSRTTPGAWWLVFGNTCSCPAEVATCWHQRQVTAFCKALDAELARPVAPPNISALVD